MSAGAQAPASWRPDKNARYVGPQACAKCHEDESKTQHATAMGRALEPVATGEILRAHPELTFRAGPYTYTITRRGDESIYTVTDGRQSISAPILYAFGQGKAGQTYVLEYEGAYYESLVSYYNEVKGLDFTIGAPRTVPESLRKALGRRLSDRDVADCFSCHSTGGVVAGKLRLEKMTPGIRCEACHGPGGAHAEAARKKEPSGDLIYNPRVLSGDQLSQDFCASCHRGNDEFGLLQSLEINNVRFQPYRMFHSKCYSDDRRISCTACHDPHEPVRTDAAYYDSKCAACHAPKGKTPALRAAAKSQAAERPCPVGTKDCVSCHMPKLGPPEAHFKFTDHFIRVVKSNEVYPN